MTVKVLSSHKYHCVVFVAAKSVTTSFEAMPSPSSTTRRTLRSSLEPFATRSVTS